MMEGSTYHRVGLLNLDPDQRPWPPELRSSVLISDLYSGYSLVTFLPKSKTAILLKAGGDGGCGFFNLLKLTLDNQPPKILIKESGCMDQPGREYLGSLDNLVYFLRVTKPSIEPDTQETAYIEEYDLAQERVVNRTPEMNINTAALHETMLVAGDYQTSFNYAFNLPGLTTRQVATQTAKLYSEMRYSFTSRQTGKYLLQVGNCTHLRSLDVTTGEGKRLTRGLKNCAESPEVLGILEDGSVVMTSTEDLTGAFQSE